MQGLLWCVPRAVGALPLPGGLCFPQILILADVPVLAVLVQPGQHCGQRGPCSHQHQVPRGEPGVEEGHKGTVETWVKGKGV